MSHRARTTALAGLPAPADRRNAAVEVMVDILPNIIGK